MHSHRMATLRDAALESVDLAGGLSRRILRLFKAQVEDWYEVCRRLPDWEDENLIETSKAERLPEHARMLDELERVGTWMSRVCASPDFPDRATAELVAMTLRDLHDARSLWHGHLTSEQRREVMRVAFNEP